MLVRAECYQLNWLSERDSFKRLAFLACNFEQLDRNAEKTNEQHRPHHPNRNTGRDGIYAGDPVYGLAGIVSDER